MTFFRMVKAARGHTPRQCGRAFDMWSAQIQCAVASNVSKMLGRTPASNTRSRPAASIQCMSRRCHVPLTATLPRVKWLKEEERGKKRVKVDDEDAVEGASVAPRGRPHSATWPMTSSRWAGRGRRRPRPRLTSRCGPAAGQSRRRGYREDILVDRRVEKLEIKTNRHLGRF